VLDGRDGGAEVVGCARRTVRAGARWQLDAPYERCMALSCHVSFIESQPTLEAFQRSNGNVATIKRGRRLYVTALLLVAFVTVWTARERHPAEPVRVTTAEVTRGAIVRRVVAVGTLQAVTTVDVGTQVSGAIESLSADFNSIVRKDEVIAKL